MENYCSSRKGKLKLSDFKSKFLEEPNLQDAVFYFVFISFRIKRLLEDIYQRLKQSKFSSMLQANTIFDLCLVLDNILKNKNTKRENKLTSQHIKELSNRLSLRYENIKEPKDKIYNNEEKFKTVLKELLESKYNKVELKPIEEDFAISLICRNYGAHQLRDTPLIYREFECIIQRIFNSIFYSIEKLYS